MTADQYRRLADLIRTGKVVSPTVLIDALMAAAKALDGKKKS